MTSTAPSQNCAYQKFWHYLFPKINNLKHNRQRAIKVPNISLSIQTNSSSCVIMAIVTDSPKRAAQQICRICARDLSSRSTVRFNLFTTSALLSKQLLQALQLDIKISKNYCYPTAICRVCKGEVTTIIQADAKRDAMKKVHRNSKQYPKKRLAKSPAEKKAEESDLLLKMSRTKASRMLTFGHPASGEDATSIRQIQSQKQQLQPTDSAMFSDEKVEDKAPPISSIHHKHTTRQKTSVTIAHYKNLYRSALSALTQTEVFIILQYK